MSDLETKVKNLEDKLSEIVGINKKLSVEINQHKTTLNTQIQWRMKFRKDVILLRKKMENLSQRNQKSGLRILTSGEGWIEYNEPQNFEFHFGTSSNQETQQPFYPYASETEVKKGKSQLQEKKVARTFEKGSLGYLIQEKIPFRVRIYILDIVSITSTRFYVDQQRMKKEEHSKPDWAGDWVWWNSMCVDPGKYLYCYGKGDYVDEKELIKLLYGYFKKDPFRKHFLIFTSLVFRSNVRMEFLPHQENLRQLYLLDEQLTLENLNKIPLSLKSLCFTGVKLKISDVTLFVKKLPKLRKFVIQSIENIEHQTELMETIAEKCRIVRILDCNLGDECAKILVQSPTIKRLCLNSNKRVTNNGIQGMRKLKKIIHFVISSTRMDDKSVNLFVENPQLRKLDLSETKVTQKGFAKLIRSPYSNLRALEWIKNEEIHHINDDDDDNIKNENSNNKPFKNKTLEYLVLSHTKISAYACMQISLILDHIVILRISLCDLEDDHVEHFLKNCRSLYEISLANNPKLTKKTIHGIVESGFNNNNNVAVVDYRQVYPNQFGDDDMEIFLNRRSKIKELWVFGTNLTDGCLDSFRNNSTLEVFKIVGENQPHTEELISFIKTKKKNIRCIVTGREGAEKYWIRD